LRCGGAGYQEENELRTTLRCKAWIGLSIEVRRLVLLGLVMELYTSGGDMWRSKLGFGSMNYSSPVSRYDGSVVVVVDWRGNGGIGAV